MSRRNGPWVPRWLALSAMTVTAAMVATALPAHAAPTVTVVHVGQVTAQDVAPLPGSEPDTVVEPDVAVSPLNAQIAVAVSHDGRYPDGGAVGISYAWTHDGGRTWHHQPVPGLTAATGGPKVWARVSDPVVAFDADGAVYISTLLIADTCPTAVAVSRSTDGGRTFAAPVLAHYSASCDVSDDKNTLVVDTGAASPHRGRIYQFWTPFLSDIFDNPDGSPQAMVYSDDHGRSWSDPVAVSAPHANTQNSTAMVRPNGTVVDAYIDYGAEAQENEDTEFRHVDARADRVRAARARAHVAAAETVPFIRTAISTDGGRSFHNGGVVTRDVGEAPPGIRCCLDAATADPKTGRLYVTWTSINLTKIKVSSSSDGTHWGAPATVDRPTAARWGVNVDVAAMGGTVAVSYGLTNASVRGARSAQQYIAVSHNGARTFATTVGVGPRSNYAYAAKAEGIFPGDYIGTSFGRDGRLYAVWCVSSKPSSAKAKYHQVVYGAVLTT